MSDYVRKRTRDDAETSSNYEDQNDLVNAVISTLAIPETKTVVAETFANDKNHATEIRAYAKIAGNNWTFYVKSLNISIGRNTDNPPQKDGEKTVDIDLGPAKVVSRQHATINFNLSTRLWELFVAGRNGAKVDGTKVPCGPDSTPTPLYSGAVVDIGGTQMMFILPDEKPRISADVLTLLGPKLPKPKSKRNQSPSGSNITKGFFLNDPKDTNQGSQNLKAFQMFNSDANHHINGGLSDIVNGLNANGGTSTTLDNDLSKDESRDIKPPYSYATMITQAILSNPEGVLSLSEIYDWIASRYAFYRFSKSGWQNSIRHNLSLNKAFEKVPRRANEPGKGMKWQISDSYKNEFLKKVQSGSLSKARRGSSVSRQLQLHLATHSDLPSQGQKIGNAPSPLTYQTPQTSGTTPQQNKAPTSQEALQFLASTNSENSNFHQIYAPSVPAHFGSNSYGSNQLPPLQPYQHGQPAQQLPLPQPTPPQSYQHSRVSSLGSNASFTPFQPQQNSTTQAQNTKSHQPSLTSIENQSAAALKSDLRPTTQSSVISTDRTEVKEISSAGQGVLDQKDQLSSPIKPSSVVTTPKKEYQQLYNTTNNSSKDQTNNTTQNKSGASNSNLDFGIITSPTKSFSISAVEAFTPQRGTRKKSQDNGSFQNISNSTSNTENNPTQGNGGSHTHDQKDLQSSPALWNFVQFSTPLQPGQGGRDNRQTPGKQVDVSPSKNTGYNLSDSPLELKKNRGDDLGDLRNVDLAKGFKK